MRSAILLFLALGIFSAPLAAQEGPADEQLHFLDQVPSPAPHRQEMHVQVDAQSLRTGLVRVDQCHYNLDPVPAAQVVFGERLKALQVTRAENIGQVRVEGRSVQLRDVARNAVLCLRTVNQVFDRDADGGYVIRNGPFMRRFLDGYFPLQLHYTLSYPAKLLRFKGLTPSVPAGTLDVARNGELDLKVLFEGALRLETRFDPVTL